MSDVVVNVPDFPVMDVADVVALEQRIAASGETDLLGLMLRAGRALAKAAEHMVPSKESTVCILAGHGNNGGDGWVAADHLARAGYRVTIITRDAPHDLEAKPARTAANMTAGAASSGTLPNLRISINPKKSAVEAQINGANLIIDCMLGTGFHYDEVKEPYATWINLANAARKNYHALILAADVPSGLYAQTGMTAQPHITADATLTMLVSKPGLTLSIAADCVGELVLAPLGINPDDYPA